MAKAKPGVVGGANTRARSSAVWDFFTNASSLLDVRVLLAITLAFSLSAKPTTAQLPFEFGVVVEAGLGASTTRLSDFAAASLNRGASRFASSCGYGFYVASFPYEGFRWRLGGLVVPHGDSEEWLRGTLEVQRVRADWTAFGLGVSVSGYDRLSAGPPEGPHYRLADAQMGVGVLAKWSRFERFYTLTAGVEAAALVMGHEVASVDDASVGGRYDLWTVGLRLAVSVPLNRARWIRGQRALLPLFSPRT